MSETNLYPIDLLDRNEDTETPSARWFAMYTRSRCEKQLMRELVKFEIPFYSPTIARRYRSPSGRLRICYDLLFSSYVFVYGDDYQRHAAETTRCVSNSLPISKGWQLREELRNIQRLIETGRPLTREARLLPGDRVKVRSGAFAGFEGTVIRRANQVHLLVAVEFMLQGASVQLDDCQLESL